MPHSSEGESQTQKDKTVDPMVGEDQQKMEILSRLQQVRSICEKSSSSEKDDALSGSVASLSEHLFRRATDRFLLSRSPESLADVAQDVHRFYSKFVTSSEPWEVKVYNPKDKERQNVTSLMTSVSDRPFVVDTASELLRARGFSTSVLLHPILTTKYGTRTSVLYIELSTRLEEATLSEVQTELESALSDLLNVTNDFKSILIQADSVSRLLSISDPSNERKPNSTKEIADYFKWLADGGFVFLGYREWRVNDDEGITTVSGSDLGLFNSKNSEISSCLTDLSKDALALFNSDQIIEFSKIPMESPVHRHAFMEQVCIRVPDERMVRTFLGLPTSRALSQEASSIPLVRAKLADLIESEGAIPNSYDYKEIVSIIDSVPKSELFQATLEQLQAAVDIVLDVQQHAHARLFLQTDRHQHFCYVMVVMLRERFSASILQAVERVVAERLNANESRIEHRIAITEDQLVRIHLAIPLESETKFVDIEELEEEIENLTLTWDDHLHEKLKLSFGNEEGSKLAEKYSSIFPAEYKEIRSPLGAINDVEVLERLSTDNPIDAVLEKVTNDDSNAFTLHLYKFGDKITLSEAVPLLENTGFEIISEIVTPLDKNIAIFTFSIEAKSTSVEQVISSKDSFVAGLVRILRSEAENDALNLLLVDPGLDVKEIAILRVFQHYLWQIRLFASERVIGRALVRHPELAGLLVNYFKTKFDPNCSDSISARKKKLSKINEQFIQGLKDVPQLTHDRAFRALLNAMDACVRTNAFIEGTGVRVALKIDCSKITSMPEPRPMYEIFINSPEFEGVHLRAGKVARGGLRWSERTEDYRTEILGLVKTQRVKNAIIVPLGAKGGFVVKKRDSDPAVMFELVKAAYKKFIRSLLEVTDNRVDGEIVKPNSVVVYDEVDPYLVVAADKGTATFSDIANEIATKEFSFWLGDAFASGGSVGYDHKLYGITARGAWEAAKHHFRTMAIDPEASEFTVTGIGDMSGDVFGNGLLLSRKAKLVAAFNHKHIFIDPEPSPEKTYKERKRLFDMPRSQWSDYNEKLISKGGGVFERSAKEIELSAEARAALGISKGPTQISGEELIKAILKAPVDLLWNGGIGTYVKSSTEDNLSVGDPSNDDVRIEASELRAKIVSEGGNLGFTQLARIEFAKNGGLINTDAVDNSAGVDLSDQEVNFKILLEQPLKNGEISTEERNKLLEQYAEEFCERVLLHNKAQNNAIALAILRSRQDLGLYRELITFFESELALDRKGETLPEDEVLENRIALGVGLTRPECAVVVAYAKMWIFKSILSSDLVNEKLLEKYLLSYFPKQISERFEQAILSHPLRREIIAAQIANEIVDLMGSAFLFKIKSESGKSANQVVSAFVLAIELWQSRPFIKELFEIGGPDNIESHFKAHETFSTFIKQFVRWLLNSANISGELNQTVSRLESDIGALKAYCEDEKNHIEKDLQLPDLPDPLVKYCRAALCAKSTINALDLYLETGLAIGAVDEIHRKLFSLTGLDSLFVQIYNEEEPVEAEHTVKLDLLNEINQSINKILVNMIESNKNENHLRHIERQAALLKPLRRKINSLSKQTISSSELYLLAKEVRSIKLA